MIRPTKSQLAFLRRVWGPHEWGNVILSRLCPEDRNSSTVRACIRRRWCTLSNGLICLTHSGRAVVYKANLDVAWDAHHRLLALIQQIACLSHRGIVDKTRSQGVCVEIRDLCCKEHN